MAFGAEPDAASTAWRYSTQDTTHRAWWAPRYTADAGLWDCQLHLRRIDGSWLKFNYAASNGGLVWPYQYDTEAMTDIRTHLDGTTPLWPIILHDGTPNAYGEPDGVMALCGNAQSSENIVTVNRQDWLVTQNIYRVGVRDFAAFRLA